MEHGIQTKYVCGYYSYGDGTVQSHAWLQHGAVIIDITGDQFALSPVFLNYNYPVYVGRIDSMHELFHNNDSDLRDTVPIVHLGPLAAPRLSKLYKIISKYIKPVLRNNYTLITDLAKSSGKPIFITNNGEDDGVFLSMEAWEEREKMFRHRDRVYDAEMSRLSGEPVYMQEELDERMESLLR